MEGEGDRYAEGVLGAVRGGMMNIKSHKKNKDGLKLRRGVDTHKSKDNRKGSRLAVIKKRSIIKGNPEDLVHLDWSSCWRS